MKKKSGKTLSVKSWNKTLSLKQEVLYYKKTKW
jgi:hypothetical protein